MRGPRLALSAFVQGSGAVTSDEFSVYITLGKGDHIPCSHVQRITCSILGIVAEQYLRLAVLWGMGGLLEMVLYI